MTPLEQFIKDARKLCGLPINTGSAVVNCTSHPAQQALSRALDMIEVILPKAQFLLERLEEFDCIVGDEDCANEWAAHVHPPMARLKSNLEKCEQIAGRK